MLSFFTSNRLFRDDLAGWRHIILSDGLGYYAYLPAILIYHDLSFRQVTEVEKKILGYTRYDPSYLVKEGDKIVNKYFAGEALALLPFFLLATFFSWIGGVEITGYSFFFQFFTGLGALFYLFLGLFYLKKIMEHFRILPVLSAIILVTILLGTNLFYYSLWQPSMSHVYSFFAINGFLWHSCRVIQNPKRGNILLAGVFLGLTVLIRPTNGIVLILLPFLFNTKEESQIVNGFLKKRKSSFLFFLGPIILMVCIQLVLWRIQTGHWFIWSYRNEGFFFGHPQIFNVLFSFRKGLFIYTPLIFLSFLGCFRLLSRDRTRLLSMILFLFFSTYIVASWWNWYYGDSFGERAFIDYYGIYALLLAILMNHRERKAGTVLVSLLLLPFVALNIFQTWQYTRHIIHPYSMNKAKYNYVFLKTNPSYQNCLGGNDEIPGYTIDTEHTCKVYKNDFEEVPEGWKFSLARAVSYAHSGRFVGFVDSLHEYSPSLEIKPEALSQDPTTFYVKGRIWIYDSIKGASNNLFLVFSVDNFDQQGNYWFGFRVKDIPDSEVGVWRPCNFSLTLPEFRNPGKILIVYLWNPDKKFTMFDDFSISFFKEKKKIAAKSSSGYLQ